MLTSNRILSWPTIPAVLLGVVLCASIGAAQEPLQFNVPYRCADGTEYIVHRCEPGRKGEVCFYSIGQNGKVETEVYNIRSQMDGWLKVCKAQSAPSGKQAAAPSQPGQALNPPYLSEMPSVERVKSEIQGANPVDTLARQVAVFTYLPQIVKRRQDPGRSVRSPLTPDEQRVISAYDLAAYELSQSFAKSHTPEEAKAFERTHGRYEMDPPFYEQWFNRLFSPAFRTGYAQVQTTNAAHAQAHVDAQRRDFENATVQQAAAATQKVAVKPGSQAEMRRCIESGRSQRVCFSEVLSNGMDQLTGISLKLPSTPGLRMTGDYAGPGGFRLIFQPDTVTMVCRGVPSPQPYIVEATNTQALVRIQNGSKPVVFALRQDGKLEGSGPIRVTGQVPAGSRTEQTEGMTTQRTTRQRELTPLEAQNYPNAKQNGQTYTTTEDATELAYGPTGTRTVTDYVTKTADCSLGLMTATGPTPLPPDIESPFGLITTIFSGASVLMNGGTPKAALGDMLNLDKAPPPGLRMSGRYAGQNGFSITFHPESATVACGDAERALEYSVQRTASQTLLKIRDNTNPIALQLKPDGSLFGEGTAQVNGRVIVGTTEDPKNPFLFAPKIGRCAVGSLVAGGPAAAQASFSPASPSSGPGSGAGRQSGPAQVPPPVQVAPRTLSGPPQPSRPAATSSSAATSWVLYTSQGDEYYEANNYTKAIDAYKKGIALQPGLGTIYGTVSAELRYMGNNQAKEQWLLAVKQYLGAKPADAVVLILLGDAHLNLEHYTEALEAYRHVTTLKPPSEIVAKTHFQIGNIYYSELRQYEKALPPLIEAARLQPDDTFGLNWLGSCYYNLKQYPIALETFQKFIRLDSKNFTAHDLTGATYNKLGQHQNAVASLREALRLGKGSYIEPHASYELGLAYLGLRQYADAIAAFQQAIHFKQVHNKKDYAEAHYGLGTTYLAMGQKNQALQVHRTLVAIDKKLAQELLVEINKSK